MKLRSIAPLAAVVAIALPSAAGCKKTGREKCVATVESIMDGVKDLADKIEDPSLDNCADAAVEMTRIREEMDGAELCSDVINQQHVSGAISQITSQFENRCARFLGKEPSQKKSVPVAK